MIALSAALIAAYGASTFWSLQRAHDQALRAAGAALESMARSAETGTTRSLFEIDAMLLGIERIVAAVLPTTALDGPALKTVLDQFNAQSLSVSDILILDAKRQRGEPGERDPRPHPERSAPSLLHRPPPGRAGEAVHRRTGTEPG